MKKYYSLFVAILATSIVMAFTSCKKDEDPVQKADIVGTWAVYDKYDDDNYDNSYIQFRSNGVYAAVEEICNDGVRNVDVEYGVYAINGDKLSLMEQDADKDDDILTMTIASVSNTELTLRQGHVSITLTRVPDSTVENWLLH